MLLTPPAPSLLVVLRRDCNRVLFQPSHSRVVLLCVGDSAYVSVVVSGSPGRQKSEMFHY